MHFSFLQEHCGAGVVQMMLTLLRSLTPQPILLIHSILHLQIFSQFLGLECVNFLWLTLTPVISLTCWALLKKLTSIFTASATHFTSMFLTILTNFPCSGVFWPRVQCTYTSRKGLLQTGICRSLYQNKDSLQLLLFSDLQRQILTGRFAFKKSTVAASEHVLSSRHLQTDCLPVCSGISPCREAVSWSYKHWSKFPHSP